MTVTYADLSAAWGGVTHGTHVMFSVCGTGVPWNVGYPWDLGQALNPNVWSHQAIGYPAQAFPMNKSYEAGEVEFINQLEIFKCEHRTWGFAGYSQGAIVTSNIMDRVGITTNPDIIPDLGHFKDTFIGGVTWGNPRREGGHTIDLPGAIDPGGHGIVTPNLVGTPDTVWDMADGKKMIGSPGNDLYTTCGVGENATAVLDQEAIWHIVDTASFSSLVGLLKQVLKILPDPLHGGIAAAEAALGALGFFVAEGIRPHVMYQFIQPVANDPRDAWRIALDHMNDIGLVTPIRIPT